MNGERARLGDMLVAAGFVRAEDVDHALREQETSGRKLGEELVRLGLVTEVQLVQVLSNQLSVPWVSLYHVEFSRELLNLLPAEVAEANCVIPVYVRKVRKAGDTLFVAMDDPTNDLVLERVRVITQMPVKPMVAPPSEIRNAIRVYYFGHQRSSRPAPSDELVPTIERATVPSKARTKATASSSKSEDAAAATKVEGESRATAKEPHAPEGKSSAAPTAGRVAKTSERTPRMITLTLLDGSTVRLPASGARAKEEAAPTDDRESLTALDLVRALIAKGQGKDVSAVLPEARWELLFGSLLSILIRKGVIADWEFVEELQKNQG